MIVAAGEALVDMVPEARPGGAPYNVAIAAARLGHPAAFAGRISDDHHGDQLFLNLKDNDVDVRLVERGPEPTARAIVEGDPPQFRFEGAGTADTLLSAVELSAIEHARPVLHGGALGLFRGRTAEVLATLAEGHDGLVSIDPNVRPQIIGDRSAWDHFHERWLNHASVYKASEEDLDWIWPGRHHSLIADELLGRGIGMIAITNGPRGATLYTGSAAVTVPGQAVEVADTVGAGDTFVASLLVGLTELGVDADPARLCALERGNVEALGARAVATAALTGPRVGAHPPHRSDLPAGLQAPLRPQPSR